MSLRSEYAPSGRAVGVVGRLEGLVDVLDRYRDRYDAVALSTQIMVEEHLHVDYYLAGGDMVNPWGGVEAMLTHTLSSLYDVPAAHAPMYTNQAHVAAELALGPVEPRLAAEIISNAFFMCVLKGLQRSPRVVTDPGAIRDAGVLTAADINCLVIPDGCVGLPTLAALEQGIVVIAVRENSNLMRNDLAALPFAPGQLIRVDNYWEAAGVMSALKAGVTPSAVRRPLAETEVHRQA